MMKIGIVSAMPIELEYVLSQFNFDEISLKKNTFFSGFYEEFELILVATGVGKVNASIYTQLLIDSFSPNYIINIGIAGGLHDDLTPLDIIVGSSFSHHDVNVKQMENLFPKTSIFKANTDLLNMFKKANIKGLTGPIVSGEKFISDDKERQMIIEQFDAVAVDMESSAMAHTCFINDIPFISLRGISDLANGESDTSYKTNERLASDLVGKTLLKVLKKADLK